MTFLFLALVIALGLIQYWGSAGPVHSDGWFHRWCQRLGATKLAPSLRLGLAVLGPPLLLVGLLHFIDGWVLSLPSLAAQVLVLLYSFGRGDYHGLVARYRGHCRSGDFEGAYLFARQELAGGAAIVEGKGEAETEKEKSGGPEHLHHWVKERFAYLGFERWFGPVFWFILLGAPGALAYRLLHLYGAAAADAGERLRAAKILHIADWVPARLLVLSFALTGDWMGSREQVARALRDWEADNAAQLNAAAHAALGLKAAVTPTDAAGGEEAFAQISDWETGELQGLLRRSMVAWVALLAAVVVLG